jgi:general secretion pathway protein B
VLTAPQRTPPAAGAANKDKRAVGVGNAPRAAPPAPAPASPRATAGAPATPDKNAGLRAPVTPPPARTDAATTAATPDKNAGLRAPAPPPPAKTDAATPAATPKTAAAAPAATPPAANPPATPARLQPPAAAAADTKPAAAAAPAGAALPTVWELPYATRKDLPAIDLSMHVFSSDPKQRFVVIKGDRHVEGDEVGTDLVLKEIRQDGIVLDYKGQVFFYPRSGR